MAIELNISSLPYVTDQRWAIILAGGEGKRMQDFIKRKFGKKHPKQFCTFWGTRSLFRHTIERVQLLIQDKQLLSVISGNHYQYALDDIHDRDAETVLVAPFNRETAPSMLLPLLHIYECDRDATVGIFPSDHFVIEKQRFMDHVRFAYEFTEEEQERIVLLGIFPEKAQPGYGWIHSGKKLYGRGDEKIFAVKKFCEKPSDRKLQKFFSEGCLINTMVLVGKAATFLKLFRTHTPDLYYTLQSLKYAIGNDDDTEIINDAFETMPHINFSDAVLQHSIDCLSVLPITDVYWSDWGEEERVLADIALLEQRTQKKSCEFVTPIEHKNYSIEYFPS